MMEIKNSSYLSNYSVDYDRVIARNALEYSFPSGIFLVVKFLSNTVNYFDGRSNHKIIVGSSICSIKMEIDDFYRYKLISFFRTNKKILYYNEIETHNILWGHDSLSLHDLNSQQVNILITLLEKFHES